MADPHSTDKVDLLHPLVKLHWERCHYWSRYYPTQCAVLGDRVAIATLKRGFRDVLYISSTNLSSWTTVTLPYKYMSITVYKSQFVAVGGLNLSASETTMGIVLASDTGLDWQPSSLCDLNTKRYKASSIGIVSPEALVVAGGVNEQGILGDVEVFIENNWHIVAPLPLPCSDMTSALHQDEIVFTNRDSFIIYSCSITSLVTSITTTTTTTTEQTPRWKSLQVPEKNTTTVSYSSRLVNIDGDGVIRGHCHMSQSWVEATCEKDGRMYTYSTSAAALPSGGLIAAIYDGVYRVKVSMSSFDPDKMFMPNVLSRLEAVMGIPILPTLANCHSQLAHSSGVKAHVDKLVPNKVMPDPSRDPISYIKVLFTHWYLQHSHRPPSWRQLLDVFQEIDLMELSLKIERFINVEYKYVEAYKHFIHSKDTLDLLSLKCMFLGPPRFGKSTTSRRVTKEIIDLKSAGEEEQIHGSTGSVENCSDMLVKNKSGTTPSEIGADWSVVQGLSDEACLLFHSLRNSLEKKRSVPSTASSSNAVESVSVAETSEAGSSEQPRDNEGASQPGLLHRMMAMVKSLGQSRRPAAEQSSSRPLLAGIVLPSIRTAQDDAKSEDYSEIAAIFNKVAKQPNFAGEVKHSFRALLRIEDTGGQPELMDMLPALTIGPGLYLLFFSYEFQLDEEYQVFYQRASGEKTAVEKSSFTLQEFLLCTLSSILCSSASSNIQPQEETDNSDMSDILESSKPVVYIVGTHKDKVSDEYIDNVDRKLQKIIKDTDFYRKGIVKFFSNDKLVVSLDNMRGGTKEIQQLYQLLERAMEQHFKKLKIPAVWLLFSLCLRMRKLRTASMETCLELSRAFNMTPHETKVALWFLHHHAGVLMYFPNVSGLEDLVIIDTQVVYDSITSVILEAMRFDNVGKAESERFRKTGQFTLEDVRSATANISEDVIPPNKLLALLAFLHIIAQILSINYPDTQPVMEEIEYIMPCVLESTSCKELDLFHKEACRSCPVFPLSVYYTCGFTPMGLFPALIACFISNKSFIFIREGVKKNMVQFLFESTLDVTFISRPTYYEVVVSCLPAFLNSLHTKCVALRIAIENTLTEASSRMNYSNYKDYQFGFECSDHEEGGHLGVVDRSDLIPGSMVCLLNPDRPQVAVLQNKHLIWYGQEHREHSPSKGSYESGNYLSVFMSVYPDLVHSVTPCVETVADRCISCGLISRNIYEQIIKRRDWIDTDQTRCLLNSIRSLLSVTPQALEDFVTVLLEVEDCKFVAKKMQQQLQ